MLWSWPAVFTVRCLTSPFAAAPRLGSAHRSRSARGLTWACGAWDLLRRIPPNPPRRPLGHLAGHSVPGRQPACQRPNAADVQAGAHWPDRPATGPWSDFGVPMLRGAQLAVDKINAVQGCLGRPLELWSRATQASPMWAEALQGADGQERRHHHRLLQHQRETQVDGGVSGSDVVAGRAQRHWQAGCSLIPTPREGHLLHLRARRHPGAR